jgi:hypothetical protein
MGFKILQIVRLFRWNWVFYAMYNILFTVARVTFHHLVCRLKTSICNFSYTKLFMICLLSRDNWSISHKWEMNPWVWYQIGLEFSEIHIQSSIKTEGSSDRRNNLTDESVKISVGWTFDVKITTANIVNCLNMKERITEKRYSIFILLLTLLVSTYIWTIVIFIITHLLHYRP